MRTCHHCYSTTGKHRHPSSYDMQDSQIIFDALDLKPGDVFLDAGCGLGEYALEAARRVGPVGMVHAFDVNPGCIEDLANQAAALGLSHLRAAVADITRPLPLPDARVTVGLLGTVLHIPPVTRAMATVFTEMRRVLCPEGRLGVIECNQHFFHGPPLPLRLAAGRITRELESCGFQSLGITDMGYNYLKRRRAHQTFLAAGARQVRSVLRHLRRAAYRPARGRAHDGLAAGLSGAPRLSCA